MEVAHVDFYDVVLVAIAASLGLGVLVGAGTPVRMRHAVLAGSLVASAFIYAGLFRDPPLPSASPWASAAVVVWHVFVGGLAIDVLVG